MMQCAIRGIEPGPINTYPGRQALGRQVKKGSIDKSQHIICGNLFIKSILLISWVYSQFWTSSGLLCLSK